MAKVELKQFVQKNDFFIPQKIVLEVLEEKQNLIIEHGEQLLFISLENFEKLTELVNNAKTILKIK